MYTIEQIEDVLITALLPLKTSLSVRDIKTYQGELDSAEEIKKAVKIFPAIIMAYGGSTYENRGNRKIEKMRFILFFCDKNLRSEPEARRGSGENPGVYAMISAARYLLCNQQLGLEKIEPISLSTEEPVWFDRGVTIYSAEYETEQELIYKNRKIQNS